MFESAVMWLTETMYQLGYPGIVLLMALESSFVPFPSEVVLPPAGYLAAQGRMSVTLAILSGLTGSLLGALFNYYLAAKLGRPVLHKYGKYALIRESSLDRAEAFFRRHGEISTFVARLLPVIRQLISVPAGFARMRLDRFIIYTAAGAGIWCVILTLIGFYIGKHAGIIAGVDAVLLSDEVRRYSFIVLAALIPVLAITVIVYVTVYRRRKSAAVDPVPPPPSDPATSNPPQ